MQRVRVLMMLAAWCLAAAAFGDQTEAERARERAAVAPDAPVAPDVPYVATPEAVVMGMLDLAQVGPGDVLYDLGSGDGRIVIAAARRGARTVGVEIDPDLVLQSRASARAAGVEDRATFVRQDLFETDFSEATVVTLYLLPGLNMKLRPKLLAELPPGARIVSHTFHMGDWAPARTARAGGARLFLWIVPPPRERRSD
jgi:SAM-dependent methyltransferase